MHNNLAVGIAALLGIVAAPYAAAAIVGHMVDIAERRRRRRPPLHPLAGGFKPKKTAPPPPQPPHEDLVEDWRRRALHIDQAREFRLQRHNLN